MPYVPYVAISILERRTCYSSGDGGQCLEAKAELCAIAHCDSPANLFLHGCNGIHFRGEFPHRCSRPRPARVLATLGADDFMDVASSRSRDRTRAYQGRQTVCVLRQSPKPHGYSDRPGRPAVPVPFRREEAVIPVPVSRMALAPIGPCIYR